MHHILHAVDERCITGWQEEQLEAGRPAAGKPVDFGARSLFMPIIYFEPIIHQCQLVKKVILDVLMSQKLFFTFFSLNKDDTVIHLKQKALLS